MSRTKLSRLVRNRLTNTSAKRSHRSSGPACPLLPASSVDVLAVRLNLRKTKLPHIAPTWYNQEYAQDATCALNVQSRRTHIGVLMWSGSCWDKWMCRWQPSVNEPDCACVLWDLPPMLRRHWHRLLVNWVFLHIADLSCSA